MDYLVNTEFCKRFFNEQTSKMLNHRAVLQRPAPASKKDVTVLDTDYAEDMALMDSTKDSL